MRESSASQGTFASLLPKFSPLLSLRLCSARTAYPEQVSPAGNLARRKAHTRCRPLTGTTGTPSKDHFVKANNSSRWKHRVNSAVAPGDRFRRILFPPCEAELSSDKPRPGSLALRRIRGKGNIRHDLTLSRLYMWYKRLFFTPFS